MSDDQTKKMQDLKSRLGLVAKGENAPDGVGSSPSGSPSLEESGALSPDEEFAVDAEVPAGTIELDMDVVVSGRRAPLFIAVAVLLGLFFGVGYISGGKHMEGEVANELQAVGGHISTDLEELDLDAVKEHKARVAEVAKILVTKELEGELSEAIVSGLGMEEVAAQIDVFAAEKEITAFLAECSEYSQPFEPIKLFSNSFHATDFLPSIVRFYHQANMLHLQTKALASMRDAVTRSRANFDNRSTDSFYALPPFVVQGAYGSSEPGKVHIIEGAPSIEQVEGKRRREDPTTFVRIDVPSESGEATSLVPVSRLVNDTKALSEARVTTYRELDRAAHAELLRQVATQVLYLYAVSYSVNVDEFLVRVGEAKALPRY